MLASELIALLTSATAKFGDLPVGIYNSELGSYQTAEETEVNDWRPSCSAFAPRTSFVACYYYGDQEDLAPKFFGIA
jgi:hypothetical protein